MTHDGTTLPCNTGGCSGLAGRPFLPLTWIVRAAREGRAGTDSESTPRECNTTQNSGTSGMLKKWSKMPPK
eukprot:10583721-Alexandrium_andersonii.AAC.1